MTKYKRKSLQLLSIIVFLVLLGSCSSTITVSYLKPAKYDLNQYKNLAIASMQVGDTPHFPETVISIKYDEVEEIVFSGYERRLPFEIAEYFTENLYSDLRKTNYFNLIQPVTTDGFINNFKYGLKSIEKLKELGADALLVSQIEYFDFNEYPIIGDYKIIRNPLYPDDPTQDEYIKSKERDVIIIQQIQIKYSYKILDIQSGDIIADSFFNKTLTKEIEYKENLTSLPQMDSLFQKAILEGEKQIIKEIAPQVVLKNIALKTDKSKNPYFDAGMEAIKSNNLKTALDNFNTAWQKQRLYAAGYNSALVLESLAKREEAIKRMEEVYNQYLDEDSNSQIERMIEYAYDSKLAKKQISN